MKVLAAAQTLNQEIGGGQNRADGSHQTIEEIHESAAFPLTAAHHPVRPARTGRHHRLVYRTIRTAGDKTRYYRPVMRDSSRGLLKHKQSSAEKPSRRMPRYYRPVMRHSSPRLLFASLLVI